MHEKRVEKLQELMEKNGISSALIMYHLNVYYFNSTTQRGVLHVPASGEPTFYVIRDFDRAKNESVFKCVEVGSFSEILKRIDGRIVGVEEDLITVKLYRRIIAKFDVVDISKDVLKLRSVKDGEEIRRIKEAAKMCCRALEIAPEVLKEGVREFEVAAKLEAELKSLGHDGYLETRSPGDFMPNVVVIAPGSAVPGRLSAVSAGTGMSSACSVGSGKRRIKRGDVVWIDIGGRVEGYCADVTRSFSVGKVGENVAEVYEALSEVYEKTLKSIREGVKVRNVYEKALQLASELGIGEFFMGLNSKVRFVGHGIGLNVDELPVVGPFEDVIERNVTLAFEPKAVLPGFVGLGIESTLAVSEGAKVLDEFPTELIEV